MGKSIGEVTEYSSRCQYLGRDKKNKCLIAILSVCSCFKKFESLDIFRTV